MHCRPVSVFLMIFAIGRSDVVASPPAESPAVVVNSGSTNFPGFRIVVPNSGTATYTTVPRAHKQPGAEIVSPTTRKLPAGLAHRLYADLKAALPFSDLPRPTCMKSASFGSTLTIQFQGGETPDLSCGDGQSPKLGALVRDAKEIVALFNTRQ